MPIEYLVSTAKTQRASDINLELAEANTVQDSPRLLDGGKAMSGVPLALFATVVVIVSISIGRAQETDAQKSPFTVNLSEAPKAYMDRCYFCHEFKVGPMLRGRGLQPDYVRQILRNGSRA